MLFSSAKLSTFPSFRNKVLLFNRFPSFSSSSSSPSSSVSVFEVTKFSEMSKEWWNVRRNPLISMNPTRVSHIVDMVQMHRQQNSGEILSDSDGRIANDPLHSNCNKNTVSKIPPLTGLRALDIGCGGGLLSESLARLGAEVTAIDPSIAITDTARNHSIESFDSRLSNINYRGGMSVEDLALEFFPLNENNTDYIIGEPTTINSSSDNNSELFDIICVLEVVEHATKPERLLAAASSLLKKPTSENPFGGILFVSTINRTSKSYALAILGAEYVAGLLPKGTHDWNKFMKPIEIEKILKNAGLKTFGSVHGMVPQLNIGAQMIQWYLNPHDTDVNWIGSYLHDGQ